MIAAPKKDANNDPQARDPSIAQSCDANLMITVLSPLKGGRLMGNINDYIAATV
jgi:hypothetical protein